MRVDVQGRTALADTAGSTFTKESEVLLAEGKFAQLLARFVEFFPLLFTKGSDKGIYTCCPLACVIASSLRGLIKRWSFAVARFVGVQIATGCLHNAQHGFLI